MFDKFKDECGVFGIFGHADAANLTYLGLRIIANVQLDGSTTDDGSHGWNLLYLERLGELRIRGSIHDDMRERSGVLRDQRTENGFDSLAVKLDNDWDGLREFESVGKRRVRGLGASHSGCRGTRRTRIHQTGKVDRTTQC